MYIMEREQGGGRPRRQAPFIARMWFVLLAVAVCSSTLPKAAGVPVHKSEVPILQRIQQAWSKTFYGWDGEGDCETDMGFAQEISCNSEGRVVSIDLRKNQLTGSIPTSIGALKNLQYLSLWANALTGSIPASIVALANLSFLDLSANELTGSIPTSIGAQTKLEILSLAFNQLTGGIPASVGALINLQSLSLDGNQLTGILPTTLMALTALTYFHYDIQSLSCPADGGYCPLKKAGYTNLMFCKHCSGFCSTCVAGDGSSGSSSAMSTGAFVGIGFGAVVAIVLISVLVCCICKKRNNRNNYRKDKENVKGGPASHREERCGSVEAGQPLHQGSVDWVAQLFRPMTLAELCKATNNFSEKRLLGSGGFGAVYLGHGPGGQKWAVKRSITTGICVDEAFKQEVLKLSRLTSPHLASLLGFCIEERERIVVYEFVENGSLRTAIRESNRPLSFEQRLTIACGVAGGLHYLHDQKPPIVHRDIKPDNILLDAQWRAKVADFGLLRALDGQQTTYTQRAGTPGYIDPEYWTSLRLTTASDVYSFGMVLLEMFTGRNLLVDSQQDLQHAGELQPMYNPPKKEGIPLRDWLVSVQEKYHGRPTWLSVVLDPSLQIDYLPVNVIEEVLQIGIDCTAGESSSRPDIRTVEERLLKLAAQLESRGM